MSDPIFLTLAQVETLHRIALEQHGGQEGIRDRAALDSAVLQPQNVFHYGQGDVFDIAAAYAFHLAESQAFIDGNKRTGMAAAVVFLKLNNVTVPRSTDDLHAAMIGIGSRQSTKAGLAALLRGIARPD